MATADLGRVIVTTGATAHTAQVHHRDFAEIRAQGKDAHEAGQQLANQLTRALDSALTNWRRESIEQAISDVKAFIEQTPST